MSRWCGGELGPVPGRVGQRVAHDDGDVAAGLVNDSACARAAGCALTWPAWRRGAAELGGAGQPADDQHGGRQGDDRQAAASGVRRPRRPRGRRGAPSRSRGRRGGDRAARSASVPGRTIRAASASVTGQIWLSWFMRGLRSDVHGGLGGPGLATGQFARRIACARGATGSGRRSASSPGRWLSARVESFPGAQREQFPFGGGQAAERLRDLGLLAGVLRRLVAAAGRRAAARSAPTAGAHRGGDWPGPAWPRRTATAGLPLSRGMSSSRRQAVRKVSAMTSAASSGLSVRRSTYPRIGPWCAA